MKILLVDFSGIAFSTYFVNRINLNNTNFWRFLVLNSIQAMINEINPNEVVLCMDYASWRKDIFPYYKSNRKKTQNTEEFENLFKEIKEFRIELKENFPYKIIQIWKGEADDIIAVLSQNLSKNNEVIIGSTDKDMFQLANDKVKIYNPIKNEFVEGKDKNYLLELIMHGDSGDGIPNVRSDDDVFVIKEKCQKDFGPKTIQNILNTIGFEKWYSEQPEDIKKKFQRNKQLISLSLDVIPKELQDKIMEEYKVKPTNDPQKMMHYFAEKQMTSFYDCLDKFLLNGQKSGLTYVPDIETGTDIEQSVESLFE
jgi:DNA polymerase-1